MNAAAVAAALRDRTSFILTSHARPDGDAVGSSLALGLALEQLGKHVTIVLADPVPGPYRTFPDVDRIRHAGAVHEVADAAVLLECSEITRPAVSGLDRYFVINVDHHLGNEMYGDVNWFDGSAAACGEQVADIIDELGVAWTRDIASHLFMALATDTGGFRYGPISARTFEICRRIAATGVETAALARQIFDSYSVGRVRLTGAILNAMELHHDDQFAILTFDDALLARCGATLDDTEGLVNLPLAAREVVAVALIKQQDGASARISLRSKGAVDVRDVAARLGGGGHRNAAGCSATGDLPSLKRLLIDALAPVLQAARSA